MTGRTLRGSRGAESFVPRGKCSAERHGRERKETDGREPGARNREREERAETLTTDAQRSPSGLALGTLLAHLSRSPAPPLAPLPPPPPPPPPSALCASSCAAMIFLAVDRSFLPLPLRPPFSFFFFLTTLGEPRSSSSRGGSSRARLAHYLGGSISRESLGRRRTLARRSETVGRG